MDNIPDLALDPGHLRRWELRPTVLPSACTLRTIEKIVHLRAPTILHIVSIILRVLHEPLVAHGGRRRRQEVPFDFLIVIVGILGEV